MGIQKRTSAIWIVTIALATLLTLSACGGGGGGTQMAPSLTNQAPVGQSLAINTNEDSQATGAVHASDADGDALSYAIASQPAHGTIVLAGNNGAFTYTPSSNYFGADQFTFQASDGKTNSAAAAVNVSVTPVNDAPQIDSISGASSADAGSQVALSVVAYDVDNTTPTLSVQQVSGTPSPNVTVLNNTITMTAPSAQSVEQIVFRIKASDNQGGESTRDYLLQVYPVSASRMLHTIRGSPTDRGLHLIVTGDGYTQDQQGQLLSDAGAVVSTMLDAPDIKSYSVAWNVHVLNAVSLESGVDIPSENVARNTIFDGALECGGSARLLCINNGKVTDAAVAALPAYTLIVVISNTDRYGGSGGAISVASRHPQSALIVLHEAGHSFAHLVDEYVDTALTPPPIATFPEASVPNATVVADTSLVKWRYWFTNPASVPHLPGELGVGLFEGAYFRETSYYRPTYNSFMRTLSQNLGAVNSEAWVLSIFQRLGQVPSLPLATTVTGVAGIPLDFSVTPKFAPALQSIKWFENGNEVIAAANNPTYRCCTVLTGQVALTVRVSEASGLVRMAPPNAAYFEKTWQIQFN